MVLRLNWVGGIARPTREGSRHPAIPLWYARSLAKHGQDRNHEGRGTHYLTNDEASMLDSIYQGAETRLITDHDNDSIRGIHTTIVAPTHAGPRLPDKMPHASGKNLWTGTKAANIFTSIQGQGLCISHAPPAMPDKTFTPPPPHPRALGKSRGKPARPRRPPRRLRKEAKSAPPGSGLRNPLEYHPPHHQEASRTSLSTVEASHQLSYVWTHWSCKSLRRYIYNR
jgi:hypothetical protein